MIDIVEYMVRRQAATDRRKEGSPRPWSDDQVINTYKFCSVIRDDDRTSVEAKNYILGLGGNGLKQLHAALFFRLLNRTTSLKAVVEGEWFNEKDVLKILEDTKPLFSNAYRIMVPGGLYNRPGVATLIEKLFGFTMRIIDWEPTKRSSAKEMVLLLKKQGLGPFVAYQTMQDLRWLWGPYEDELSWAYIGPGALRGLSRMAGNYKPMTNQERRDNAVTVGIEIPPNLQVTLNDLLAKARDRLGPQMTMFEIEHNLCEWDKYCRYASGETSGTRFKPKD